MNNIQTVTKQVRLQQWTSIIQDCRTSGKTVDDYCTEHDISRNAYYYWLRKVKETVIEQSSSLFSEVKPPSANPIPSTPYASPICICIGDAVIHVNEDSSSHLLRKVMEAVRNAQ